ncbi:MAG: hypothetical protein O7B30_01575 [Thaumarchaeota archaeon]|nr:hypothetical protein [Nitrososphaerota archaeon]
METTMSWMKKTSGVFELESLLEDMDYDNKLRTVKVLANQDLNRIEMGSYILEATSRGSTIEVPRWLAEILASERLVTFQDSDVELELYKALSLGKIQGSLQLSSLRNDFYPQMRALGAIYRRDKEREDREKFAVAARDLITIRVRKLLSLAALSAPPLDIEGQIPKEERVLYERVRDLVRLWRDSALGDLGA